MRRSFHIVIVLVGLCGAARAEPFGQIGVGATASSDVGVDLSPTLSAAAGYRGRNHTALLTFAFTPARIGDTGSYGTVFMPGESPIAESSLRRLLVLANLEGRFRVSEWRSFTVRFGIGADMRRSSWVNPQNVQRSRSENGLALQLAGTYWFECCHGAYGIELGATLASYRQPPFGGTDLPGYTTTELVLSLVGRLPAH